MAGKIKRSLFAIFLNTTPSTETATYALMGQGITSQKVDYGPETSDETYVSQDSGTVDVESYKPKISTQQTAIQGDAVFDYAKSIGVSSNDLTKQQKIQAEYNGIMEETRFQTGDAAKLAGTYSGSIQQLGFNFNNLKIAVLYRLGLTTT